MTDQTIFMLVHKLALYEIACRSSKHTYLCLIIFMHTMMHTVRQCTRIDAIRGQQSMCLWFVSKPTQHPLVTLSHILGKNCTHDGLKCITIFTTIYNIQLHFLC